MLNTRRPPVAEGRGRDSLRVLAVVAVVAATVTVGQGVSGGATAGTFANTAPIQVPRPGAPLGCPTSTPPNNSCPPTPALQYPSTISVAGLEGTVTDVNVTLHDVTYTLSDLSDLDILLINPDHGIAVQLMSDVCGDAVNPDSPTFSVASPIDLTFDDTALLPPPADDACGSGTFQPLDDDDDENFAFTGVDVYCGPNDPLFYPPGRCNPTGAPVAPETTRAMSAFAGCNPNGDWKLYVVDDYPGDPDPNGFSGQIAGGWSLEITTSSVPLPTITLPPPSTTEATTTTTTAATTTTTTAATTTTTTARGNKKSTTTTTPATTTTTTEGESTTTTTTKKGGPKH